MSCPLVPLECPDIPAVGGVKQIITVIPAFRVSTLAVPADGVGPTTQKIATTVQNADTDYVLANESIQYTETPRDSRAGTHYEGRLRGFRNVLDPAQHREIMKLTPGHYIVIFRDELGHRRVLGNTLSPARFRAKPDTGRRNADDNAAEWEFVAQQPAFFLAADVAIGPPTPGFSGLSVTNPGGEGTYQLAGQFLADLDTGDPLEAADGVEFSIRFIFPDESVVEPRWDHTGDVDSGTTLPQNYNSDPAVSTHYDEIEAHISLTVDAQGNIDLTIDKESLANEMGYSGPDAGDVEIVITTQTPTLSATSSTKNLPFREKDVQQAGITSMSVSAAKFGTDTRVSIDLNLEDGGGEVSVDSVTINTATGSDYFSTAAAYQSASHPGTSPGKLTAITAPAGAAGTIEFNFTGTNNWYEEIEFVCELNTSFGTLETKTTIQLGHWSANGTVVHLTAGWGVGADAPDYDGSGAPLTGNYWSYVSGGWNNAGSDVLEEWTGGSGVNTGQGGQMPLTTVPQKAAFSVSFDATEHAQKFRFTISGTMYTGQYVQKTAYGEVLLFVPRY